MMMQKLVEGHQITSLAPITHSIFNVEVAHLQII